MLGSSIACLPIEPESNSESDTASAWVEVEHARATGERSGLAVEGTCVLRRPNCPENVVSRFLSLLQSGRNEILSADFWDQQKRQLPQGFGSERVGGSRAERYGKSLSKCRSLSPKLGAWPIYSTSFFVRYFRRVGLVDKAGKSASCSPAVPWIGSRQFVDPAPTHLLFLASDRLPRSLSGGAVGLGTAWRRRH